MNAVVRGDVTSRDIRIVLGVIWLVDGVLQLQPFMFTKGFVTQILEPNAAGQPVPVAHSILTMAHFLQPHLVMWNALFASAQLAIGVGLCFRRTAKPALVASFAWSLLVWWFAEGLGGLLTGSASPLTGAPGAALLYAAVGLFAWPRREPSGVALRSTEPSTPARAEPSTPARAEPSTPARAEPSTPARAEPSGDGPLPAPASGLLGTWGARAAWCTMWLGFAALSLAPANASPSGLSGLLVSSASGEPGPLGGLDRSLAHLARGHGLALSVVLAAAEVAIGIGAVSHWHPRRFIAFGAVVALIFWVVGQGFGGVLSGQGTDPNTGPLVLLLGLATWGALSRPILNIPRRGWDRTVQDRAARPVAIGDGGLSFDA